jgi:hydroxymethylpyrimidine kinase/phosphomethylpyrimidine kinase/thiamine-phosphate diphosphorylase
MTKMAKKPSPIVIIGASNANGADSKTDALVAHNLDVAVLSIVTTQASQKEGGVEDQHSSRVAHVAAQLQCINFDQVSVVKIGLLGSAALIKTVAKLIPQHVDIVLDLVISSCGERRLSEAVKKALMKLLIPRARIVTSNAQALSDLCALEVNDLPSLLDGGRALLALGAKAVFAKGGIVGECNTLSTDIYCDARQSYALSSERWQGVDSLCDTQCGTAAVITCLLNQGTNMDDALVMAKGLINQAIALAEESSDGRYRAEVSSLISHHRYVPKRHPIGDLPDFIFPDCGTNSLGIYPVVDSAEWIEKLLPLGVSTIQLRIKQDSPDHIEHQVSEAIRLCKGKHIRLFINDHWQLAIKHAAYGIHLGQEDIETADLRAIAAAGLRLGISSHCWWEVARALAIAPSYLALGPIYATSSKDMPWVPQGVDAVRQWVSLMDGAIPLVAIGGIDYDRARLLKQTGVGSVAMISAITQAPDYQQATRKLLKLWQADEDRNES